MEVKAHRGRCYGDKDDVEDARGEDSKTTSKWEQSCRLDRAKGRDHCRQVLTARGKMMKSKATVPSDCLMTNVARTSPRNRVRDPHWFEKRLKSSPVAWTILRLVLLKKPDAKLEKGIRESRATALTSVLAKSVQRSRCSTENRSRSNERSCMVGSTRAPTVSICKRC